MASAIQGKLLFNGIPPNPVLYREMQRFPQKHRKAYTRHLNLNTNCHPISNLSFHFIKKDNTEDIDLILAPKTA